MIGYPYQAGAFLASLTLAARPLSILFVLLILIFSNNSGQNFSTTFKCCIIKAELNDLFLTEYDEKLHERPLREEDRMEGIK